jgi:hypothetical protein
MKPTDPTDIINWEAMHITTPEEQETIKEVLDREWLAKYNN